MKVQVAAVATVSTTLGWSAFAVEAKKLAPRLAQRKTEIMDAIQNLDSIHETKRPPLSLKNIRKQRQLVNAKISQLSSNIKEDESGNLDLGIIGSTTTARKDTQSRHRQMKDILGEGLALVDRLEALIAAPVGFGVNTYCDVYGDDCNACGTVPIYDPVTAEPTGMYNVELDCPTAEKNGKMVADLASFCNGAYFCDGCEPLCQSCSVDMENFVASNQNCLLTEQLKEALDIDGLKDDLAMLLVALAQVQDLFSNIAYLEGMTTRPLSFQLDYFCEEYGSVCNACGTSPVNDPITGESTGAYNLLLDCPSANVYNFENEIFQDVCDGEYFCEGCEPLCESCILDRTNLFMSKENCFLTQEHKLGVGLDKFEEKLAELNAAKGLLLGTIAEDVAVVEEDIKDVAVDLPEEIDVQDPVAEDPPAENPVEEEPVVDEPVKETTETEEESSSSTESRADYRRINIVVSVFAGITGFWMTL